MVHMTKVKMYSLPLRCVLFFLGGFGSDRSEPAGIAAIAANVVDAKDFA